MARRLPVKSGKNVLKTFHRATRALEHLNIAFKRMGKGDHVVLHNGTRMHKMFCKNFSVPLKREVAPGTLLSVIGDAGMTKEEFLEYDP